MPDYSQRSNEPEIMDDFQIDDNGLRQTLRELEIINYWLGGNFVTIEGMHQLIKKASYQRSNKPLRIVDLGCGSGDMLRLIDQKFSKKYKLELVGVDANPAVIEFAKQRSTSQTSLEYQTMDIFSEDFKRQKFDIVLCTLFTHHFEDKTLIDLLKQMKQQANLGIVINDIHRHWFAYHSIKWLTQLFSRSYMTKYDAKLSVLRAFTFDEIHSVLTQAGWTNIQIKWKWAFRWQIVGLK